MTSNTSPLSTLTEYSENKIIEQSGLLEKEAGPGVLQSSIHQTCFLQEFQRHKAQATEGVVILSGSLAVLQNAFF